MAKVLHQVRQQTQHIEGETCRPSRERFNACLFLTLIGSRGHTPVHLTDRLRAVDDGHAGHWCELTEELQGEVHGGLGGETLQQKLLNARETAPPELGLQLFQALAILCSVQGNLGEEALASSTGFHCKNKQQRQLQHCPFLLIYLRQELVNEAK